MSKSLVYFRDEYGEHFVDPLLVATAERLGVDLASTESPAQLQGMQEGCARCQSQKRCADWLLSSDGDDHRSFCANTDSLERLWMRAVNLFDGDRLKWVSFKRAMPETKYDNAA
jgi:hypothetical protein